MIPPHVQPVMQADGTIVRGVCWCDPHTHFHSAVNDEGETYFYPHTTHLYELAFVHHCAILYPGKGDAFIGPPI